MRSLNPSVPRILVAVFLGGTIGTLLRWFLAEFLTSMDAHLWTIGVINVMGAGALGFLVARMPGQPGQMWRSFLGTGLLGGFTTYSALAAHMDQLVRDGSAITAVVYAVLTLVLGVGAAELGRRWGGRS